MNRHNTFYIKYTSWLSKYTYQQRISYLNTLLINEYAKDADEFLMFVHKHHEKIFKIDECANIIRIIQKLNFSKKDINISFYNILLDSSTDITERINIKKRKSLVMSFIYNIEREWFSMGYNAELLNILAAKSSFLISLKLAKANSEDLVPLIKRNIKLIEFNNKLFDIDNYIEAFQELAHYNGNGIQDLLESELEGAKKEIQEIKKFRNKIHEHLISINMENKKNIFLNTLVNNKKSLFYLYNTNYCKIKSLVNLNKPKEKSLFLDYINGYELYRFANYPHEYEIDDRLKYETTALSLSNFIKGGNKNKDHEFFTRDNIIYTSLEKDHDNYFTTALIEFCSKREKYTEYFKNKYFRSNSGIYNKKFKVNEIEYYKVEQKIANDKVKDFTPYNNVIYEHKHTFTNEVEDNMNSILLKLDLNLPRKELEYFIKEFLDNYHKKNHKIPSNKKTIKLKIKKIIDILFIYDGKLLNISNEDIIEKLYFFDAKNSDRINTKIMSKATFQKYLKIGVELIDNKGYLEIANGNKSIFDII